MSEGVKKRVVSNKAAERAPQRFHSVLVPVDLTPSSDRVLGRVALLPLTDDARLTLVHVVPEGLRPRHRPNAARDAKNALADEARHLAKSLPRTVHIDPVVKIGVVEKEIAACARAAKAELIVTGRGGGRALRDAFLGSTAERVIRRSQLPVLVVRLPPRAAYRRPALALEVGRAVPEVLIALLRAIQPSLPRVAVIHACDDPYRGVVYPSLTEDMAEKRQRDVERNAAKEVERLLAASLLRARVAPKDAPRWDIQARYGSPRLVIERAVEKADTDLLALGTRGYSGVAHMFVGTVAGDVLRDVTCDVLVVPPVPRRR